MLKESTLVAVLPNCLFFFPFSYEPRKDITTRLSWLTLEIAKNQQLILVTLLGLQIKCQDVV